MHTCTASRLCLELFSLLQCCRSFQGWAYEFECAVGGVRGDGNDVYSEGKSEASSCLCFLGSRMETPCLNNLRECYVVGEMKRKLSS